jgi:hypothetical protein
MRKSLEMGQGQCGTVTDDFSVRLFSPIHHLNQGPGLARAVTL